MTSPVLDFVCRLTSTSRELTEVHRKHIADQGELLPHVLMGEIARLVIASASREQPAWLPKLLQQLEVGLLSGDSDVAELIGVSFVENLSGENAALKTLIPTMGETLRREVRSICGA
jgi:hypothetical protein